MNNFPNCEIKFVHVEFLLYFKVVSFVYMVMYYSYCGLQKIEFNHFWGTEFYKVHNSHKSHCAIYCPHFNKKERRKRKYQKCKTTHRWPTLVQFQHSSVMPFLHLNIFCGSPLPHYYMCFLGSVSTFKSDDLSILKHLCMGASTTPLYPELNFNMEVWWPYCTSTFMWGSPSPHHYNPDSVSTFKHDDLSLQLCSFICLHYHT